MADTPTLMRYDITDLNNGVIAEFPVEDPPGWDAISLYYAKALQNMGWNESGQGDAPTAPENPEDDPVRGTPNVENTWQFSDRPDTYFFWGAMHWWPGREWEYWNTTAPSPRDQCWSHCTHGDAHVGKYFLPWHRAYIYFFEVIVRAKVAELGGPAAWALPYWNYSHYEPANPSTPWPRARLPWVFFQPTLPDGTGNPLHLDGSRRGLQPTWPDGQPMFLRPGTPYYAAAYGQPSWAPALPNRGFNSTLDGRPHGLVHVDTGNGDGLVSATGWMQNTQTAGFDPIFWLHHSQIDRFWVGWNAAGGQNPNQQTDPAWLTAADDEVNGEPVVGRWNFWSDGDIGNVVVVHPGDMLDPASLDSGKFPHSYEYQDLPLVPAPRQGGRAIVADAVPGLAVAAAPAAAVPVSARHEIASNDQPIEVGHEPVTTQLALADEASERLRAFDEGLEDEGPHRVILQLDRIVTKNPPGNYEIYLNNPEVDRDTGGEVPNFVGMFSAFGAGHRHGGEENERHGESASYDITDLVAYLRARGEWDESAVRITFVPAVPRIGAMTPVIAPVTVGSVRVVTE
jgi:tyrosinase